MVRKESDKNVQHPLTILLFHSFRCPHDLSVVSAALQQAVANRGDDGGCSSEKAA
jgi:hypothetical protein